MPVTAKEGLVSRKKDLPSEKYGGYNKPTASYFIMAKYTEKGKKEKQDSGCDLTLIGGKKQAAVCTVSSKVSNWGKNFKYVKIIDESASGIFRKESENILEWL